MRSCGPWVVPATSPSARSRARASGPIHLDGLIASGDGHVVLRLGRDGEEPEALGARVARDLLERGGAELLGEVREAAGG